MEPRPEQGGVAWRVRGRGSHHNPGNRFEAISLTVLGEHADEVISENPDGTSVKTAVYWDRTRRVLNHVDVPDIGFSWTINPYRGCEHGCVYCYARPGHEYLGMSCGLDFETKIVAKADAGALLREELLRPAWRGETVVMSGVTDPYQPVERALRVTRSVLEVMAEHRQPVGLITKSALIRRDVDVLGELARHGAATAAVSLTTLDARLAATLEPRASAPRARLEAIAALAAAGVPVRVMTAPIIPGVNDREIPSLLAAARDAGATAAGYVLLRLPWQVKEVFTSWLRRELPRSAARVESLIRQTRGGALYESGFGVRQRGTGAVAQQIGDVFRVFAQRCGLDVGDVRGPDPRVSPFVRPAGAAPDRAAGRDAAGGQMRLFDAGA
ncbi:MAG: radical SAM protein [Planctomyces sp.]|nr:radical SAM protein [Planctomyces sp.]